MAIDNEQDAVIKDLEIQAKDQVKRYGEAYYSMIEAADALDNLALEITKSIDDKESISQKIRDEIAL